MNPFCNCFIRLCRLLRKKFYHLLEEKQDDLCVKQFWGLTEADDAVLQAGHLLQQLITGIRDAKQKNGLKPRESRLLFLFLQKIKMRIKVLKRF